MTNDLQVYVVSGIDTALLGMNLGGWELKIAHETPEGMDAPPISGKSMFRGLSMCLGDIHAITLGYRSGEENPYYIYFFKQTTDIFGIRPVVTAIRLFKLSNLGMAYPLSLNEAGGGIGNVIYDYHSMNHVDSVPPFSLSEEEYGQIQAFYAEVSKPQTDHVKQMIQLFHEAYRNRNSHIAFIMRVTILEMLIDGNAELVFRLSRSVAVLLGRDRAESQEIFEKCKKIYGARSKFLHDGKTDKITPEAELLTLDYARRVIANLICIREDIDKVRKTLDVSGFGENPFQVQF